MRGAAQREFTADQLHFASLEPVRVGMPELCRAGLSENWLLKACGHRHWLALAKAYGLPRPDFRAADGARLYPAFTSVRLCDGKLDRVGEDDMLQFAVTLSRIGHSRFRSVISVACSTRSIATLTMESAFVQRTIEGRNRSASRAIVALPCALPPPAQAAGRLLKHAGRCNAAFDVNDRQEIATHLIDPSPHEDFNGADFLYFAAFQAMLDRAEWHWFHHRDPLLVTARRKITYLGNIELGEQVRATLCCIKQGPGSLDHWIELARATDSQVIAIACSRRRLTDGHHSEKYDAVSAINGCIRR